MFKAGNCELCGREVNVLTRHTNKRTRREFNSLELLASHPDMARFMTWIRRKPDGLRPPNQPSSNKREKQKPNATPW